MVHRLLLVAALVALATVIDGQDPASAPPANSVRGRVVDAAGTPIEGAAVAFVDLERAVTAAILKDPAFRTDKDGRFRLPPGAGSLLVAANGKCARYVYFSSRAVVDAGDVVLQPGGTLTGVVHDDEGKPVAGAYVKATQRLFPTGERFGSMTPAWSAGQTNQRGEFRLPCAPTSAVSLSAYLPGYALATRFPVGTDSPLNLVLEKTGFVSGKVVDADGRPRATQIWIGYEAYEAADTRQHARSRADGTFRLPFERPGSWMT